MTEPAPPRKQGDGTVLYEDADGHWRTADKLSPEGWRRNCRVEIVRQDQLIQQSAEATIRQALTGVAWYDQLSETALRSRIRDLLFSKGLSRAQVDATEVKVDAGMTDDGFAVNVDIKLPPVAETVLIEISRELG